MEKHVLIGGPHSGKTTMLNILNKKGYIKVDEAAREISKEEKEKAKKDKDYIPVLPQTNMPLFERYVLDRQAKNERNLESSISKDNNACAFLDRSKVDVLAYCNHYSLPDEGGLYQKVDDEIRKSDYNKVFLLDTVPGYTPDPERDEDEATAIALHNAVYGQYLRLGYDIIKIPFYSDEEGGLQRRVEDILSAVEDNKKAEHLELEGKYFVRDLLEIRNKLESYNAKKFSEYEEDNTIIDYLGLLGRLNYTLRLRKNGRCYLTFKGKNKGSHINKRLELERAIPDTLYDSLLKMMPKSDSYHKHREVYRPKYDGGCEICLDKIKGLGDFVEIEASSENQITLWKERLGIASDNITKPYYKIERN